MDATSEAIVHWLVHQGFHIAYESTAIYLLAHAELPGVEARVGTVYSVVERDGVEIYRTAHRDFDPAVARERIFGATP